MKSVPFIILGVLVSVYLENPIYTATFMSSALLFVMYLNKNDANIIHLCIATLIVMCLEKFCFIFIPLSPAKGEPSVWINNTIYLTHLFFDVLFLFIIIFRGGLSRVIYSKLQRPADHLHLTFADIGLMVVVVLFMIVDLWAVSENLLRNLEHIGFSEEFAKNYWDVNWLFHNYSNIKIWIMGFQFLTISAMITEMAKRKYSKLPA